MIIKTNTDNIIWIQQWNILYIFDEDKYDWIYKQIFEKRKITIEHNREIDKIIEELNNDK